MIEENHPHYQHHYDMGSVIHKIYESLHHWAIEGDFSDKDLYPLPYENNSTAEEKLSKVQNAMTETSLKLRSLEFHFGPPEEIERLERRSAALEHHMSCIIAENHLNYTTTGGIISNH